MRQQDGTSIPDCTHCTHIVLAAEPCHIVCPNNKSNEGIRTMDSWRTSLLWKRPSFCWWNSRVRRKFITKQSLCHGSRKSVALKSTLQPAITRQKLLIDDKFMIEPQLPKNKIWKTIIRMHQKNYKIVWLVKHIPSEN